MIELRHLTKSYRTPKGRRYVFRDLNFHFPDNVSIGLIGRNGAGKSTLMRLLGGIDTPDSGEVFTDARISWPVGLGGGFQGSLSARENVRFVCRIYGTSPEDVRRKIKFVEDFAEIGEYFDLPMKTYSSGMRSRIGFGLSMAFDFDYYLIDEAMSVGDASFKAKSMAVFKQRVQGANMILVSHSMNDIKAYCDVVVLVDQGATTLYENVEEGIKAYKGLVAAAVAQR